MEEELEPSGSNGREREKISVVIPMYNTEAFIGQCIRSVTAQTYRNLEILVIDDGSADNGAAICQELMKKDKRIRLLQQENGGVSSARNHGIRAAEGEYVFFLDSDDAVPPFLLEEMLTQMKEKRAQLGFCGYRKLDSRRLEAILEKEGKDFGERKETSSWMAADEKETEEWFHIQYTEIFSGIGGKMILREAIGELRFDTELSNGEDTFFLYGLVKGQVRSVCSREEWYYYRIHGKSVTNSSEMAKGKRYFESARRIRDSEYERNHEKDALRSSYAMRWEILTVDQVKKNYMGLRAGGEKEDIESIRQTAARERKHPLFRRICFSDRVLFDCCFHCYPLYKMLNRLIRTIEKRRTG